MASKTSASVGMMVSLAVFALLSLVLFVLTVVFAASTQRLTRERDAAVNDLTVAVRADERDDRWEELKRQSGGRTGVVRYLDRSLTGTIRLAGGGRSDTAETFRAKAEAVLDGAPTMLAAIERRDGRISDLQRDIANAERDRDNALSDMKASNERVKLIEDESRATVARLNTELDKYRQELENYRLGVESTKTEMIDSTANVRAQADRTIADLESRNSQITDRLLVLEGLLDNYRTATSKDRLRPQSEAELVDARVIGVNPGAREVYLSIGRSNHVVLGMTFEIYSLGTTIRADAEGNYPPGKATVEIIRIDDSSSTARVIRETRGNPIIEGDFGANPVYDPNKKYVFVIYGNFDMNRDGVPTAAEANEVRAIIDQWGGVVRDEVSGDTDFLVLGTRPVLPPEPKNTDPIELIQRYLRMKQTVQRYDDLFETAKRTGIPVLNQNRFETLTGMHGQR